MHGHRGARARFPENTLAGFHHAIEAGADFLELDLAVTADDVVVACHDPVLRRTLAIGPPGSRVVRELKLSELRRFDCGSRRNPRFLRQTPVPGARVPTLDEVFELGSRAGVQFNLEAKSYPARPRHAPPPELFARLVIDAIRRRGLESRVIVQSFDARFLREAGRLAPGIRLAALYGVGFRDLTALARETGARIVAPHYRMATRKKVAALHDSGLEVICWTVNSPRQWRRLIRAGVDGIITDDPAALVRFLREQGLR